MVRSLQRCKVLLINLIKQESMNSKEITNYKKSLRLTKLQKSILFGKLLGDGHLESLNNGKTFRLKIEHSMQQKDYVDWMYQIFKPWVRSGCFEKIRKNGQQSFGFQTYSHGELRFLGQQFYQNGKKVIPKVFSKQLDKISLAVWYMDDGSKKSSKHKTYIIHSLGYSKVDLEKVCEVLFEKFKIKARLHKQKNKYYRIYILSESAEEFKKIIEPYVSKFKSMEHKL